MLNENIEYGVTSTGFVRKRLPEIQEDIFRAIEEELGTSVSRQPNSLIGVIVGIFASEIDRQWQLEEQNYYDRSPMSAGEGSIDNTLAYTMVTRKEAQSSYLYAICYGKQMTIPSNAQIKDNEGNNWRIASESNITLENCVSVTVVADNPLAGVEYGFKIDDKRYTYTTIEGDTVAHIYTELINQINKTGTWTAKLNEGKFLLNKLDRRYGSVVTPLDTFDILEVGTPIRFNAEETGEIDPPLYSVNTITTVYNGWTAVANESKTYVGRERESLNDLRLRYASAVFGKSVGMKESIKAAILALEDVTNVAVYENRSDYEREGLKPHSFKAIVQGGDDREIAQTILNVAPVGIDTNGEISVEVADDDGMIETIYFDRPVEVVIEVRVNLHRYMEETYLGDTINNVKDAIIEYGSSLEYGKDLMPQRFMGNIFKKTTGISHMEIEMRRIFNPFNDLKDLEKEIYLANALPVEKEYYNSLEDKSLFWKTVNEDAVFSILSEDRKALYSWNTTQIPMEREEIPIFTQGDIVVTVETI